MIEELDDIAEDLADKLGIYSEERQHWTYEFKQRIRNCAEFRALPPAEWGAAPAEAGLREALAWRDVKVVLRTVFGAPSGNDPLFDWPTEQVQDLTARLNLLVKAASAPAASGREPVQVAGRMEQTFAEHTRRLGILIADEQRKPLPDNALIAAMCDSIRLAREAISVIAADGAAQSASGKGEG